LWPKLLLQYCEAPMISKLLTWLIFNRITNALILFSAGRLAVGVMATGTATQAFARWVISCTASSEFYSFDTSVINALLARPVMALTVHATATVTVTHRYTVTLWVLSLWNFRHGLVDECNIDMNFISFDLLRTRNVSIHVLAMVSTVTAARITIVIPDPAR